LENLCNPALPYLHIARLPTMATLHFSNTDCFLLEDKDEEQEKEEAEAEEKKRARK